MPCGGHLWNSWETDENWALRKVKVYNPEFSAVYYHFSCTFSHKLIIVSFITFVKRITNQTKFWERTIGRCKSVPQHPPTHPPTHTFKRMVLRTTLYSRTWLPEILQLSLWIYWLMDEPRDPRRRVLAGEWSYWDRELNVSPKCQSCRSPSPREVGCCSAAESRHQPQEPWATQGTSWASRQART